MKRLKIAISSFALLASLAFPGLAAAQTASVPIIASSNGDACSGLNQLGGTSCGGGNGQNEIAKLAKAVVNILSIITGIAAVIMIIVAGIRFLTSGGDSNAVSSAKNTLVYAIIGLAVVALAQVIVHFVLNAIINGTVNASG